MSSRRVRLTIQGLVQGVCFRLTALDTARSLGVAGWVRNLEDGAVEILAQGSSDVIEAFLSWCHRGPEGARVDSIKVVEETITEDLLPFRVIR